MDSDLNNQNDQWELNLNIDDFDLRLTPILWPSIAHAAKPLKQMDLHAGGEVTLKDLLGIKPRTIHHKVIDEGGYRKDITVSSALILPNVLVFSKPSMHYLKITMRNVVKVFFKDTVPGSGSGVGGSEMLMKEEEIVKLMEENVTDQDEETLNLALKEAKQARAEHERLEKRRQEDLDEEHERQL
ncbi:GPCR kinase [Tanacetum coccineum]